MKNLKTRIDSLIAGLIAEENAYLDKAKFCDEHNFQKEKEWLLMKKNMIHEMRLELEKVKTEPNYEVHKIFYFN